MKKSVCLSIVIALSLGCTVPAQAAVKAGAACTTKGQISKAGSNKFECKLNTTTNKLAWKKIVVPSGFSCSKSKKAYPLVLDTFESLASYMDIVKGVYPDTDPFYIKTEKQINAAAADLKLLKDAIKRYC
jgi:hypothetical protein